MTVWQWCFNSNIVYTKAPITLTSTDHHFSLLRLDYEIENAFFSPSNKDFKLNVSIFVKGIKILEQYRT